MRLKNNLRGLSQMAWQVGVLALLLVQTTVSTTLRGQIPGISVKETASDCGACTGKLEITLPDGIALPLEIELKEHKKTQKIAIDNKTTASNKPTFSGVCLGEYELTFTALADGLKGLTCAKKTVKGVMKGGVGEASFAVNLVSNANQRIEISTTAQNPVFSWSVPGNNTNILANAPAGSHSVTVTDGFGCQKTAGPFAVPGNCYNANGEYVGKKFEIELEQMGMSKPALINMLDPITLRAKVKIDGVLQTVPADYRIFWKTASGQIIGTESSLLITPGEYAVYQSQGLNLMVANSCETRMIPIKLQACGGGDPQVLKEIFTTKTTGSCKAAENLDLKTGAISVSIPLPQDGIYGVSVLIGEQNLAIQADAQRKKGTAIRYKLAAGTHTIKVLYGNNGNSCAYNFTVEVPVDTPTYQFMDFVNGQCNFKAICKNGDETKVAVPPARVYSTELGTNSRDADSKCQPKVDCTLGKVTATRLNGGKIDAITTYAGIFEDIINTVLKDPNSQLTAKERAALLQECENNHQRFDCRVIKFCPGSFTVVDESKPFLRSRIFLRQHNHDKILPGTNCRELSCGKGSRLDVFTTCDPQIKAVVNITDPQGPTGGICNTPPPPPDDPEDVDDGGTVCKVWRKRVPLSEVYYNQEYRSNPFYQGSQINQIIDALDARIQAVDAITKRGDAKERFLSNNCITISYCETSLKVNGLNFGNVLNTIKTLECSSCEAKDKLTLGQLMAEVKRGTKSVLPGSDLAALVDEFNRVNTTQDENQMVSRYACVPVPICVGGYIKNIDVVVQQMKARVNNACPTCSASIFIQMPLNELVALFRDGDPYSPTSKFATKVGKPLKPGGQLEKLISDCGGNHGNPNNKNCISVLFCVDDPSQSVYDFANVKLAVCSQYCPKNFHEHEISLHPNDQELVVAGLEPNDELPLVGKYFQDTLMVMESFKTFAPIVNDGSISPKAITQTAKGNFYYNYSHDVSRIHNIKDSTLLFRHEDWDNDNYWFVDAAENGIKNEFVVFHSQDTFAFAAPLESDSLLRFTQFTVRDSLIYLSGYYTGALRYRAELVDEQPTHAHVNGFVLRINQKGDLRGAAIIENIDTTLNGFRVALGKTGDVLVAGKVKSNTLRVNQNDAATGLIGGGFVGTLHTNTYAFNLLSRIDLEANAQILRATVEANQAAYALLVGNTNGIAQQAGSLQVGSGNKVAALSLNAQGTLQWVKYFNGNIDPRQLDLTFGAEQRLNVGITYAGNVFVDTAQYFSSQGKQDIGLIQFDQQGQYRWHRSYGGSETETVVELLYDAGILYFGGNFAGAQGFRSIGGYDFYNPTPFHERAYVSYYADSVAVDTTVANTPELAALSAPVLQKSSTPDRTFKVFPNPFKDEILTEFETQNSENMSIEILNELGRVVKTQRFEVTPGFNRQQISTQQFPVGIYFIYLRNQAGQVMKVQKLVKM